RPALFEALQAAGVRGLESRPVLLHRTGAPCQGLVQLVFPVVAEPAFPPEDWYEPRPCPTCGVVKLGYQLRGRMRLRRAALRQDTDAQCTAEWFGWGGEARHEYLI